MDGVRQKRIRTKGQSNKMNQLQQENDTWKNYDADEQWYRVVSDDNSIYEYDLNCVGEKSESN